MNFAKILTKSEAKWKLIRLPRTLLEAEFPEKNEIFDVEFKGEIYKLKLNTSNQIMISQLFAKYKFKEGDTLKIKSTNDGFKFNLEK
jgi:hypothetical protein